MSRNPETFRMPTDSYEIEGGIIVGYLPSDLSINPNFALYGLRPSEAFWRDRFAFLRDRGYSLRRRYRPDWIPVWPDSGMHSYDYEDSWQNLTGMVIDAYRHADQSLVAIKCRPTSKIQRELDIHRFVSSPDLRSDPQNHCVPLLDVFDDPSCVALNGERGMTFLVTPWVYSFDEWPFQTVANAVDFVDQMLESIAFLHANGIAHRDCSSNNVRVDARALYPHDWPHPVVPSMNYCPPYRELPDPDWTSSAVRYCLIDFNESSRRSDSQTGPLIVSGRRCIDQELPELSLNAPYDAFPVDVFLLGNLFKHSLLEKYRGLEFLRPLVQAMTLADPSHRPSIAEARNMFHDVHSGLSWVALASRLRNVEESVGASVIRDVAHVASQSFSFVRRLLE